MSSPNAAPRPEPPSSETLKSKGWWQTMPGMLTALAGTITAFGGLLLTLNQVGVIGGKPHDSSQSQSVTVGPAKPQEGSPGISPDPNTLRPSNSQPSASPAAGSVPGKFADVNSNAAKVVEAANTALEANVIAIGMPVQSELRQQGSLAWFKFPAPPGNKRDLRIQITLKNLSSSLKPQLGLYNSRKSLIREWYDTTPGADLIVSADSKAFEEYYVMVQDFMNDPRDAKFELVANIEK